MRPIRFFLLLVFASAASEAWGQSDSVLEQRMPLRVLTCSDILLNTSVLLPRYTRRGARDSVEAVLQFRDRRCGREGRGYLDPVFLFRLLYAVDTGNADALVTESLPYQIRSYPALLHTPSGADLYWYPPTIDAGYYPFLQEYGAALADRPGKTPTSQWVARFFASGGDSAAYDALQQPDLQNTPLNQAFSQQVRVQRRAAAEARGFISFSGSVLLPQGPLQAVGVHPALGFSLGALKPRWLFEIPVSIGFGNSAHPYIVPYNGQLVETNYYHNIQVGARADYAFFRTSQLEFAAGAGAGYEGLIVVKDQNPKDGVDDSKAFSSLNLNTGVAIRHYVGNEFFIGVTGRYNFLFYDNPAGTNLSGNCITIGFVVGSGPDLCRVRRR